MRTAWPALLFGALALLFPYWYGPTLASDLLARNEPAQAASEAAIKRAQCRSFFFIISMCKLVVAERGGAERELHYALSGPVRQERLSVLGSAASPAYLTTSLGRDHLVNRAVTFAAWTAILLVLTVGGVRYHTYHRKRAASARL